MPTDTDPSTPAFQPPGSPKARGPIRDDVGKPARLLTIKDLKRAAKDDRPELRLTADRLRHAIKAEKYNMGLGSQMRVVVAALIVLFGTPMLAVPFMLIFPGAANAGVIHLSTLAVMVALVSIAQRMLFQSKTRKLLAYTAVAEGVCGSCAFSLEGSPVGRAITPRCPSCKAPVSVFNRCGSCDHRFDRPVTEESACITCGECGSVWLNTRLTRPHWAEPVHESIRSLWYGKVLPGLRPKRASLCADDRGRYVYVPDARLLRVPHGVWERLGTTRRELARETRHAGWGWRVGTAAPFLLLTGLFLYFMAVELLAPRPEPEYWIGMILLAALFAVPAVITVFSGLGRPPRTTARRLADLGLCGSCLTPLEGLTPDDAGMVDCPTCGASWRAAAPARAIPSADAP